MKPLVSLIIPVYNDELRLRRGIPRALWFLRRQTYAWEILIVDDGSGRPVRLSRVGVHVHRLVKNTGKGAAIAAGVALASGKYIVFSDADFSVAITTLSAMLDKLRTAPVVIGSRRTAGAVIAVHQPLVRETAGRIFSYLSDVLCAIGVTDATCGFKGFARGVAKRLFAKQRIRRWAFDTELLFLARKYGIAVTELPVVWKNKHGSKVRFRDAAAAVVDLARIRWYDWQGLYA